MQYYAINMIDLGAKCKKILLFTAKVIFISVNSRHVTFVRRISHISGKHTLSDTNALRENHKKYIIDRTYVVQTCFFPNLRR